MASPKGYSIGQIRLHWVVAALILFQVVFGEDMGQAWDTFEEGGVPVMTGWVWAHIIVGVLVLGFAVWRLTLRRNRGVPAAPEGLSKPVVLAGEIGHWALYAVMIAAPLTGLAAWFGGIAPLAGIHSLLKPLLIILVIVHVAAGLWHHFIRKDGLLLRMRKPLD